MNLRINLILATEKRSASPLNPKSVARVSAVVLPALVLIGIVAALLQIMFLKWELSNLQKEWELKQPKQKQAESAKTALAENTATLDEIGGWTKSRINWSSQILAFMKNTPPDIMYTTLRINHNFSTINNKCARSFSVAIFGKSYGTEAQDNVKVLRNNIAEGAEFGEYVQEVKASIKADESQGADKNDRIFDLDITYKPRMFQ